MKNKLLVIILVIAALFVLVIVKDQIVKTIASMQVSNVVGTKVEIGNLSLGLLNHKVKINNFAIFNPSGYPYGALLDISKIQVNYDLPSILKGKLHLIDVKVDLKEVTVIKNKEGKLNVDELKVAKKDEKASKPLSLAIDNLDLSIGRVIFKDYNRSGKLWVEVYDVGIKNRVYKNITSAQQFISLILVESLKPTAIKSAAIYGAASLAGMSFFPFTAAVLFTGKDYAATTLRKGYQEVYRASVRTLSQMGNSKSANDQLGQLDGEIGGAQVTIKIEKKSFNQTYVSVTAREFMFPKLTLAEGILLQIEENLK
ncbi:MAG: hypothetical protein PHY94_04290 [Candidatus Omnitrophica bacterium]|nr:hypothetical protein [Candidatus Omnitrophota bacterium]